MKKRCLILFLILALALSACGGKADSKDEVSGVIQPMETEPAVADNPVSMGRLEGGEYINSYTGYGCKLDSDWTFYSAEELQEMPENVKEVLEGSELGDNIDTLKQFTDMFAENVNTMATMNVLYQKLSMEERLGFAMMDETQILEAMLQQEKDMMTDAYAQAGFEVKSMETVTVSFLGQERAALKTECTVQDVPYYTLQLFSFDRGQYSVTLTLASYVEDNTASLLELFYPVA